MCGVVRCVQQGQANNHFNSNKINPNLHPKPHHRVERDLHTLFSLLSLFLWASGKLFSSFSHWPACSWGGLSACGESHFGEGWAVFGASRGIVCNVKLAWSKRTKTNWREFGIGRKPLLLNYSWMVEEKKVASAGEKERKCKKSWRGGLFFCACKTFL